MTSRERILAAMRREPADRVPVTLYEFHDFGGCWAAEEPSYRPLLDLQSRMGDAFVMTGTGSGVLGDPHSIRERPGDGDGEYTEKIIETPKGRLTTVSRKRPNVATKWIVKHAIETDEDVRRFLSLEMKFQPPDLDELKSLEDRMGHRGVLNFGVGDPLGNIVGLFDFEDFVMRCYRDISLIREIVNRADEIVRRKINFINSHFSDAAFRFWGPEYTGAPLMDPRRFFRPLVVDYLIPLVEMVHQGGNIAVLHCHGRLDALLEMIVETGADVLEPLEVLPISTADITFADISRRVGGKVCLAGGMQALDLDTGTPDLVSRKVKSLLDEGIGIVLPTSTPLEVPLPHKIGENYRAMFETVREYSP